MTGFHIAKTVLRRKI